MSVICEQLVLRIPELGNLRWVEFRPRARLIAQNEGGKPGYRAPGSGTWFSALNEWVLAGRLLASG
jgi:hypothetical protein